MPILSFVFIVVVGSLVTSALSAAALRSSRRHLGAKITWAITMPAVLLHELLHVIVLLFFGIKITELKLKGAFIWGHEACIKFAWNPKSIWHRIGIMLSGLAPVLFPVAGMVAWGVSPVVPESPLMIGVCLLGVVIVSGAMGLSAEDWSAAFEGVALFVVALGFWAWFGEGAFWTDFSNSILASQAHKSVIKGFVTVAGIQVILAFSYAAVGLLVLRRPPKDGQREL